MAQSNQINLTNSFVEEQIHNFTLNFCYRDPKYYVTFNDYYIAFKEYLLNTFNNISQQDILNLTTQKLSKIIRNKMKSITPLIIEHENKTSLLHSEKDPSKLDELKRSRKFA
jgi:hypothetical protein